MAAQRALAVLCAALLVIASAYPAIAFSEDAPGDSQRILVLLDDLAIKSSHSLFFGSLAARGYTLDFKSSRDSSLALKKYGEFLYDAAIIFAPHTASFGGSIELASILEFVDAGHDLIVAGAPGASDIIRDLALECGVDMDEDTDNLVIDHQHFASVPGQPVDHTLVVATDIINASVIVGPVEMQGPVVYQGIGLAANPASDMVLPILSASPAAFTANPASAPTKFPALGSSVTLVAATQARNNARVLISGSLALFSDKFFRLSVAAEGGASAPAGTSAWTQTSANEQFAVEISKWVFHERGHLKAVNLSHHKVGETSEPAVYRITDDLEFSVELYEWTGKEWIPYAADDVQVQFFMMSPYVLKALQHNGKGLFSTSFQVPDVYGVFQFKVDYKRLGYTTIALAKQIPVRPFRHDEFERFIPAAFPYYASCFSMMAGFFAFGFVFLYHKD